MFSNVIRFGILEVLGVAPIHKLSLVIRSMMRPKDIPESNATYNWVDWFLHLEYTPMKAYGFKVAPH